MESIYNPQAIEAQVQEFWTENKTFKAEDHKLHHFYFSFFAHKRDPNLLKLEFKHPVKM